jgi:outer membrane protein OmpA-like peptidoglycan-associated protein
MTSILAVLLLSGLTTGALAQAPTAQEMIERLKTPAAVQAPLDAAVPGPKTRGISGMRNLTVDKATTQEAAAASGTVITGPTERPSLSLQIQFDFDSTRVKPESQQALANLAAALKSDELLAAKFAIEGHTDAKGKADYNQRLSQHRADAVRLYLISKGIDSVRLSAVGKGAEDPANKEDPTAAENRRVKIVNQQ